MNTPAFPSRPLILGVGNLLMGDEGIGVHAARHLEQAGYSRHADVVDGGTGGFHLLGLLQEHTHVILIDAALDGQPPGTVSRLRPRFASDFPRSLSAHDIGLKDLIEAAALLGPLPRIDLITVSISTIRPMTLDISVAVQAALTAIEQLTLDCLREAHTAQT